MSLSYGLQIHESYKQEASQEKDRNTSDMDSHIDLVDISWSGQKVIAADSYWVMMVCSVLGNVSNSDRIDLLLSHTN